MKKFTNYIISIFNLKGKENKYIDKKIDTIIVKNEDSIGKKSNVNKIRVIKPHFHGDHFGSMLGFNDSVILLLSKVIPEGIEEKGTIYGNFKISYYIENNIKIKTLCEIKKGGNSGKEVDYLLSFPYFLVNKKSKVNIVEILEWDIYGGGIEAQLSGRLNNLMGINLYLVDYYKNKKQYLNDEEIIISIGGLIYSIGKHEITEKHLSKDFTGYINEKNKNNDEFSFIGKIINKKESIFYGKKAYILEVKIANGQGDPDFIIEMFCLKENIKEDFQNGDTVSGFFWMFGYIDEL